jgi:hypothetical protein
LFRKLRETTAGDFIPVKEVQAKPQYPPDHQPGMRVPKGGSSCSNCEYLGQDEKSCTNKYFIKWNGGPKLPAPADSYCSDWYEPK